MHQKIIFSLVLASLFFSCRNNTKDTRIILNNGMKWKINTEMMPPLEVSKKLISEFVANDEKDFYALADKLKENNKLLISSCTMKGKSHDELHKWLHPYMTLVDDLENAENESEANQVFKRIEQSFIIFNQYFE